MAKVDNRLRANELPTDELVDGVLILGASALMITPGFITDITGFLLLLPVTRIPLRSLLKRRFTAKMGQGFQFVSMGSPGGAGGFGFSGGFGRASTSTSARSSTPQGAGRIWDAEVVEPDAELSDPGVSDPGPGGRVRGDRPAATPAERVVLSVGVGVGGAAGGGHGVMCSVDQTLRHGHGPKLCPSPAVDDRQGKRSDQPAQRSRLGRIQSGSFAPRPADRTPDQRPGDGDKRPDTETPQQGGHRSSPSEVSHQVAGGGEEFRPTVAMVVGEAAVMGVAAVEPRPVLQRGPVAAAPGSCGAREMRRRRSTGPPR